LVRPGLLDLVLHQAIEPRRIIDPLRRQAEQLAASAVNDGNIQLARHEHDALAHMFERQSELIGFLAGSFLQSQQAFHRGKDDRSQNEAGKEVSLQRRGRALESLV
jgi:hypothetical protein